MNDVVTDDLGKPVTPDNPLYAYFAERNRKSSRTWKPSRALQYLMQND